MRGRNYSLRCTLERMRRFWLCCRQLLPYRIMEGLPVCDLKAVGMIV
jgi:hypothetical protein